MRGGLFRRYTISRRLLRPLIGIVVAYAVAAQSLLIALGGFSLPVRGADGAVAFELCLHDSQGSSELPADNTDHTSRTHCIFCFAGSHHAVFGVAPAVFTRAYFEITSVPWATDPHPDPRLRAYSIAGPRGPPLNG